MASRGYEGMFLLDSGRYATDHDAAVKDILDILERVEGKVDAHRPWADGRLAYSIDGHRKGLHYVVYFKMDSGQMDELTRLCNLQTHFIRFMVITPPEQLYDVMAQALLNPEIVQQMQQVEEPPRRSRRPVEVEDEMDEELDIATI